MDPTLLQPLLQSGLAGLIAYLWLMERRAAANREKQLDESHAAIVEERQRLDILIAALESNTRAITTLELAQRRLVEVIERSNRAPDAPIPLQARAMP